MEQPYEVVFGTCNWTLLLDGDPYVVRYDEAASEGMERALAFDFEKHVRGLRDTHEWRVVNLRSTQAHTFDTFLYVFKRTANVSDPPLLVVDRSVKRIAPNRLKTLT